MRIEADLSEIEMKAVGNEDYRRDLHQAGFAVAAVLFARLDEAVRNGTIRVGDIVAWGPAPYGTQGLIVLALDEAGAAWCCSENGSYYTVRVEELRKPHAGKVTA
jgi:hypothetical protein